MIASLQIRQGIKYAIDLKGVSIAYPAKNLNFFLEYPEAAIWLIMSHRNGTKNTLEMLAAILGCDKVKTENYIKHCLENWKSAGLIE